METLDARGLICPLPVLKARKKLLSMQRGAVLRVLASDKNTLKDFPLFCEEQGYTLQSATEKDGEIEFIITGSPPARG